MRQKISMFLAFPALAIGLVLVADNSWGTVPPDADFADGRMTGGGSVFTDENDFFVPTGTRVTHGFQLHCDASITPNNLQVNTHLPDGGGSRFHLEELVDAVCWNDPEIEPRPPVAPFDHYWGFGVGRLDGVAGFCADWIFTDAGEPGTEDRIELLRIWDCGTEEFFFSILRGSDYGLLGLPLTFGNHQAHRQTGGKK
ncbi:MAG: hypothetical protein ACSLE2_16345 [Lysobacterales bacterium]